MGAVDTGSDLTIMGGDIFKQVAAAARLHKRDFDLRTKCHITTTGKSFRINGRLDLDVFFADHTMKSAIYVKMDAPEPLLLSEGVCRQLGIVQYHSKVKRKQKEAGARVPAVRA